MKNHVHQIQSHYSAKDFRDFLTQFIEVFKSYALYLYRLTIDQEDNMQIPLALILHLNPQRNGQYVDPNGLIKNVMAINPSDSSIHVMAHVLRNPETWTYEVYHRTHIVSYTILYIHYYQQPGSMTTIPIMVTSDRLSELSISQNKYAYYKYQHVKEMDMNIQYKSYIYT